jgi:hypothetical protein
MKKSKIQKIIDEEIKQVLNEETESYKQMIESLESILQNLDAHFDAIQEAAVQLQSAPNGNQLAMNAIKANNRYKSIIEDIIETVKTVR